MLTPAAPARSPGCGAEVLSLTWPQIDFTGGFMRLEPGATKNSEGRAFPLIPELRTLLERRQAITRRLERAQARIIAHVFRYGRLIRNLQRTGISRSVAMKLTGHTTEAV